MMANLNLEDVLASARVLVCVGSGGVGKTTVASALAYRAAENGRRVLVLTVDPSQRLKSTMGIGESDEIVRVTTPEAGADFKGELWASVIDPKKTFDSFILRASKFSKTAEKLLNNQLYIQLSTTLSGSQEFTALEKLYSSHESGKFDLIVLDTPPTKHAIDFLEAPQKLSTLFNDSIAKWFRHPEGQSLLVKVLQTGTKQVLKALELLTGSQFMKELSEFFRNIEGWQDKLTARISEVHRLLVAPQTHFILVSSLDEAKIMEAQYFAREIKKGGYQLSALIINRAEPYWVSMRQGPDVQGESALEKKLAQYYIERLHIARKVESAIPLIVKLPDLRENISDMSGVLQMKDLLFSRGNE
jgi:anion-transporting  ArsA/GET3 family ATPase